MEVLFIISIIGAIVLFLQECLVEPIPDEYWGNKELYYKDIINGVSIEQCMKNFENGKYKSTEVYPEPHRDPVSGKIVIENCKLYYEDARKYGAWQAQQWVKKGKYNLTPEELRKEQERINAKYDYLHNLRK